MNSDQPYIIVEKGAKKGEKIVLSTLPATFGRIAPAEVIFELSSISRRHARIFQEGPNFKIEDLGSRNGTFVNNVHVEGPLQLTNGDHISLGNEVEFVLVVAEPDAPKDGTLFMKAPGVTGTETVIMENVPPEPAAPPKLVITTSGKEPAVYSLTAPKLRIGRLPENDIVIDNPYVSRYHAELEKRGPDYFLVPSPNISNTLLLDGQPVMEPTKLHHGAKIRIGGFAPGEMAALDYLLPMGEKESGAQQIIKFSEKALMSIGRDKDNAIVLPAPSVSRFHAEVEKIGQRYRVRDLHSSNGTFVNGKRVDGETWVHPSDAIQIGPYRFLVDQNEIAKFDQSEKGVSVDVYGLNKWVSKKLNIIQDISLAFEPREFVVVVGQSGGGKSTLVDAISGYRPATHGHVIVNGTIDVYKEFDSIRSNIGYVPQKDIIHMELTVFQALNYAAQLRMPADTTVEERHQRVEEVMKDLDLAHRKDTQISQLSGGQQKRVSIGVELLTKPGLFFLDEPTSGLDPGMETELMRLMRRLADQGRTIIMITHATKNVMLADKVVFLARGGYLTWFGPPEEALIYFDKFRTERDRRSSPMAFDNIYTLLDNRELGSAPEWAERFKKDPAYQKYIEEPLKNKTRDKLAAPKSGDSQVNARPLVQRRQISALRQFFILSSRNLAITTRDRFSLILLLLTAPLMASLDFVVASGIGRSPYSFTNGNFNDVIVTLIVLSNTSILVGGLAFMRELVKEREIYKRERMVNLHLSSYIMSKIWFALILAVYQALVFTIIRYIAFDMPGGTQEKIFFYITEFLLIVAGMMLGLFASALAPNANSAPLLLILFIIPQMVLSGALVPLPAATKAPASSSWAMQSVLAITGAGSDVAADSCWNMSKDARDNLTLDQKNSTCSCMGENALRQSSCDFPGLGKYYNAAIDQADPVKPADPGSQPQEPQLPAAPSQPADPNNLQLLQKYLSDLTTYNNQVSAIQDKYKQDVNAWQKQQQDYATQLEAYQKSLTDLEIKRAIAVGSAESTISRMKDQFSWAFVDKKDRAGYFKTLYTNWGAQGVIILVLFVAVVFLQKRRDVV